MNPPSYDSASSFADKATESVDGEENHAASDHTNEAVLENGSHNQQDTDEIKPKIVSDTAPVSDTVGDAASSSRLAAIKGKQLEALSSTRGSARQNDETPTCGLQVIKQQHLDQLMERQSASHSLSSSLSNHKKPTGRNASFASSLTKDASRNGKPVVLPLNQVRFQ